MGCGWVDVVGEGGGEGKPGRGGKAQRTARNFATNCTHLIIAQRPALLKDLEHPLRQCSGTELHNAEVLRVLEAGEAQHLCTWAERHEYNVLMASY